MTVLRVPIYTNNSTVKAQPLSHNRKGGGAAATPWYDNPLQVQGVNRLEGLGSGQVATASGLNAALVFPVWADTLAALGES